MLGVSITDSVLRTMILAAFPGITITSEIISRIRDAAGWTVDRARSEIKKLVDQTMKNSAILRGMRAKLVVMKAKYPGDAEVKRLMDEQVRLEKNQNLITSRVFDLQKKLGLGLQTSTPTEIADLGVAPLAIAAGIAIIIVIVGGVIEYNHTRELSIQARDITLREKTFIGMEKGTITPEEGAIIIGAPQWYEKIISWAPYALVGWFGLQMIGIYRPGAARRR